MIDKDPHKIQGMFAAIAHRYDTANRLLSFRSDVRWRRIVSRTLLPTPGRVLDLASGTGDLAAALHRIGRHRVVSSDFTFEMLLHGRKKLARLVPAVPQVAADALSAPFMPDSFDGATVAFGIRNFADPLAGLRETFRLLRAGGVAGILEFSTPAAPVNRFYQLYFRFVLPRIGGLVTGRRDPYEYLPKSVGEFPEGEPFMELMQRAGFVEVTGRRLSAGIVTYYRGVKP